MQVSLSARIDSSIVLACIGGANERIVAVNLSQAVESSQICFAQRKESVCEACRSCAASSFISVTHMRQSEGCSVVDRKLSISLHHLPSPDQSYARMQCRFASLRNPLHEGDDVAVAAASCIVQEPPVTRCFAALRSAPLRILDTTNSASSSTRSRCGLARRSFSLYRDLNSQVRVAVLAS